MQVWCKGNTAVSKTVDGSSNLSTCAMETIIVKPSKKLEEFFEKLKVNKEKRKQDLLNKQDFDFVINHDKSSNK